MSTTDLYALNMKSVTHMEEFRNGWGSAPFVWDFLGERYIADHPIYSMEQSHLRKVWALADDPRLSSAERTVLMLTFDYAFVPRDHMKDAAEACENFYRQSGNSERVNHWGAIGDAIGHARLSRHARGVCLSCTSVSDIWQDPAAIAKAWSIYEEAVE